MKQHILFVIGITNSGKSTFLERMKRLRHDQVNLVEVGKQMRAKYPPEYFQGQGAPEHTAKEAWAMMVEGVAAGKGKFTLVDGQPRDIDQMEAIYAGYVNRPEYECRFLHLTAPYTILAKRANFRDGADPARYELTMERLKTDARSLYFILSEIYARSPGLITTVNTHITDPLTSIVNQSYIPTWF